jgi:host cell factor
MTVGLPAARFGHCMQKISDHQFVVFGGTNGVGNFFNDVHIYDATSRVWKCLSTENPAIRPRALAASAVIGNFLLIHGGVTSGEEYLADAKIFHLENSVWSHLRTSGIPPSPRYGHSLVLSPSGLLLIGGWQGLPYRCDLCGALNARLPAQHREFCEIRKKNIPVAHKPGADNAYSLNLQSRNWEPIPTEAVRYGHAAVPIGPHVVVFGGWDGNKALADITVLRNKNN